MGRSRVAGRDGASIASEAERGETGSGSGSGTGPSSSDPDTPRGSYRSSSYWGVNHHHPGSIVGWASTFPVIFRNYGARKFMSGVAVLIPIVATLYLTWWFIEFFDTFFSPIYDRIFDRHVFGLGFITAMVFIFLTGVFTTSWIGSWLHAMSESAFSRVPVVKHIYSTAKQIAAAVR